MKRALTLGDARSAAAGLRRPLVRAIVEAGLRRTTGALPSSAAIHRVIAERSVRVVYQPVVDLSSKKVFAYEALVRPTTSDFDGPLSLFAAAVENQVTGELGRLIRQVSIDTAPRFPLFLNIHPAELNERFLVQPDDPIFQHELDVYLEITEGVPLSHFRLCQSILTEVRGRGVYLVVDDLGAGYSNLKYIADLQPRVVKIDRGLVAGLTVDSRMFKLVAAVVSLCTELGASVVAEGIETPEELGAVRDAGATYGQGYLLARPNFPPPEVNWVDPPEMPRRARVMTKQPPKRKRP